MEIFPPSHRFNDPAYLESAFKKLKETDFSNFTFVQAKEYIWNTLDGIPIISTAYKAGQLLVRARVSETVEPFNRLSKLTLRKAEDIKNMGRANLRNEPIFYCSTNPDIAIKEAAEWHMNDEGVLVNRRFLPLINPHVKFITVSIWKITKDLHLSHLFFNPDALKRNVISSIHNEHFKSKIKKIDSNISTSMYKVLEFFANEFAKKKIHSEIDYLLSAFYSNHVYQLGQHDGVVYPSVANNYIGENIAITKSAYENKLEFSTAFQNIVFNITTEIKGHSLPIGNLYQVAERKGDILIWKDLTDDTLLPIDESF